MKLSVTDNHCFELSEVYSPLTIQSDKQNLIVMERDGKLELNGTGKSLPEILGEIEILQGLLKPRMDKEGADQTCSPGRTKGEAMLNIDFEALLPFTGRKSIPRWDEAKCDIADMINALEFVREAKTRNFMGTGGSQELQLPDDRSNKNRLITIAQAKLEEASMWATKAFTA